MAPPPEPKGHFPSLDALGLWLSWGLVLVSVVGGLGLAAFYRWRFGQSARTAEDLWRQRQGDLADVRRLKDEVAAQKWRAEQAEEGRRQAVAASQGLREHLAAAETEVERLRSELSWAPVRSQMAEIALNRLAADPYADLDIDEDELPDDRSEQERLAEEAKRLKDQLATLGKAGRRKQSQLALQKVLNGEEQDVFWSALRWAQQNKLWLHPQVSMGEFLKAKDSSLKDKLFRTFNARRVDFLISDSNWTPVLVIEHQGGGHRQGNWRLHDLVKGVVLRLAGLPLVETFEGEKDDDIIHPKLDAALAVARSRAAPIEPYGRGGKQRTV